MATKKESNQRYAIKEAAKLSGLPESTLRYYESIGLINPIGRDSSSKHRIYSEDDINLVVAVVCLSATGMSIEDMRAYLRNRDEGATGAKEQVELLEARKERLAEEEHYLKLRRRYVNTKILYWHAVASGNKKKAEAIAKNAWAIAKKLKLPQEGRTNINKQK
jgi:DNA-binding transcriptional MerR regulator